MTKTELLSARDTAGARYAEAVNELIDAYTDLAAIDQTLMNARVAAAAPASAPNGVRTFHGIPQILGNEYAHPVYLDRSAFQSQSLFGLIETGAAQKLAAFEGA